jgi:Na+-driven multidrug efflux pump
MAHGDTKASRGSLIPVLLVLGFALAILVGVIALTGIAGLFIVLAISSVLAFAAVHYVLWGWWLTRHLRAREPENDDPRDEP